MGGQVRLESADYPRHSGDYDELPAPWLMLGSGGLRGLAHVGVWRTLVEAGMRPAGIIGTSIGPLVGALEGGDDLARDAGARA